MEKKAAAVRWSALIHAGTRAASQSKLRRSTEARMLFISRGASPNSFSLIETPPIALKPTPSPHARNGSRLAHAERFELSLDLCCVYLLLGPTKRPVVNFSVLAR